MPSKENENSRSRERPEVASLFIHALLKEFVGKSRVAAKCLQVGRSRHFVLFRIERNAEHFAEFPVKSRPPLVYKHFRAYGTFRKGS
jgi:hypothetical protein